MSTPHIDAELDEILDKFFELPYPDYNMGLLPDEEGYDDAKIRRNYEEQYARDEAKADLKKLIARERLEDAQMFWRSAASHITNAKGVEVLEQQLTNHIAQLEAQIGEKE